jgi:exopolysaccharide/PEP-CTERM locus tyrosine autokinase
MSRIDDAIEKARQLRQGEALRSPVREAAAGTNPRKPQPPAQKLEVTNPTLVAANNYNYAAAEEYRKLKFKLDLIAEKQGYPYTVMVTSAVGGDGKSTTAINLAITLAGEFGRTVVLIDADLRKPTVSSYLGIEPELGLAHCLTENLPVSKALINTGVGNLLLLPAGKQITKPESLFGTERITRVLDQIRDRFPDCYIVIDISPVLPFNEARVTAKLSDGVLFVVKEGGAALQHIRDALDTLKEENVIGTVYNKATKTSLTGGYYYYYRYYDIKPPEESVPVFWGIKDRLFGRFQKRNRQKRS